MPNRTAVSTMAAAAVACERDLDWDHQAAVREGAVWSDKEQSLQGQDRDTDQVRDGGERVQAATRLLGGGGLDGRLGLGARRELRPRGEGGCGGHAAHR